MRWLMLVIVWAAALPLWALTPDNVLIVANENSEGSVEIAEYYARHRGIDPARILKIKAPTTEEITREQFNSDIWEPVRAAVLADDKILAVVSTRGVPLKVKQQGDGPREAFKGRDLGSVDGELALIRHGEYSIDGVVENPYFNKDEKLTLEHNILAVTRLDGATVELAKGLVDKAVIAEALGPVGRSYLDTGSMRDRGGGYVERDDIMRQIADVWTRLEFEFHHDEKPAVMDLSTFEDPLHYYGWYANRQTPAGEVKFRTGGICVHLHSFSASTVRGTGNWVGPLLRWNATASYGTVYEPYTVGFPYENIFWDRVAKGYTFGEAGQMANRLLSWQAVFVGCVLYRPYPENFAEVHAANRARVLRGLNGSPMVVTPGDIVYHCYDILSDHEQAVREAARRAPSEGLDAYNAVAFLVQGMGLDAWVAELAEPLHEELKRRLKQLRQRTDADPTDTAELERALTDWKGLPVYDDLVKLRDEVAVAQERAASRLLRRARSDQRSRRWLRAYQAAAEAAAHKFCDSGKEAREVLDEISADAEALAAATAEADRALEPAIARAQTEFDRGRHDRAQRALGDDWRWMPQSDKQKEAAELAAKIAAELAKE